MVCLLLSPELCFKFAKIQQKMNGLVEISRTLENHTDKQTNGDYGLPPRLTKPSYRAVADCTYVLHTASPFPTEEPEDEQTLINPAVNGTLNVLRGCREAKTVKRVVLTSCVQAITGQQELDYSKTYKETDWSNTNGPILPYAKSKTLAEKAAWKFVQNLPGWFTPERLHPSLS